MDANMMSAIANAVLITLTDEQLKSEIIRRGLVSGDPIKVIADLDRCMAIESFSDAYKEIVGMRPYIKPDATAADIWAAYNALCMRATAINPLREVETPETVMSYMDRTATVAADGSRSWTRT